MTTFLSFHKIDTNLKIQQKIQMQHRVRLLEQRTANKNKDTKVEQAKLGILRAEKAKTTENIHNLSGKGRLSANFFQTGYILESDHHKSLIYS